MIGAGYLFVLAVEGGHFVNCAVGAACSPIERAIELLDTRSRPAALAYSSLGTLRRAIGARIAMREALDRWHARGCWFRVPLIEGPEFRAEIRRTLNRFERGGVPIQMHHIDMAQYFATQRRMSLRVKRRFTFGRGGHLMRTDH